MRIVGGIWSGRVLHPPANLPLRPTTERAREALMNVLAHRLDLDGLCAADLFAGTGCVAFELLSAGAEMVIAVEKNRKTCEWQKHAASSIGAIGLRTICKDVFGYLENPDVEDLPFVFADPPYELPGLHRLPQMVFDSKILVPGGLFVLEHRRLTRFDALPGFEEARTYGEATFSFFLKPE